MKTSKSTFCARPSSLGTIGFAAMLASVIAIGLTAGSPVAFGQCPGGYGGGSGGSGDGGSGTGTGSGGNERPGTGGGQGGVPTDIGEGPTTPTGGGGEPTGGGGSPTTGGGPKLPVTPGGGPSLGGPGGPKGPTTGGGYGGPKTPKGGPGVAKKNRTTVSLDRWDLWWALNREAFLASRAYSAPQSTRQRGFLDGFGTSIPASVGTRPAPSVVAFEVVPALRAALQNGDSRVQSAAAIALGRIVPRELCGDAIADLETALGKGDSTVRESALLALGVLGDRSAVKLLWQVMNDTLEGRALLTETGSISSTERSFAALGLGYARGPDAAAQFQRLLSRSAGKDAELGGCATLGLGLLGANAVDQVPFLGEMLCDKGVDRRVRAQVPIALARIGEAALPLLPYLLQFARDTHEDALVRESCVIGLSRLAAAHDTEILAELRDLAREDKDGAVRHYAFLALAQIGARGGASADAEVYSGLARFLVQQLEKGKNKVDQPWAALACGIFGASLSTGTPARRDIEESLLANLRSTNNPSLEGALAIALGLAAVHDAGADLLAKFAARDDAQLRAHIALALGLIGHRAAIAPLRAALAEPARPELRIDSARALELLGDRGAADELLDALEASPSSAEARSLACAVVRLRDPLVASRLAVIARDNKRDAALQSACCEALGLLAERSEVPFTARLTGDLNVHAGLAAPAEVIERL